MRLANRTGVNTGEVRRRSDRGPAARRGDPVNVAARLEQARRRARGADRRADVPARARRSRGRARGAARAERQGRARAGVPARRARRRRRGDECAPPLVGRERELDLLLPSSKRPSSRARLGSSRCSATQASARRASQRSSTRALPRVRSYSAAAVSRTGAASRSGRSSRWSGRRRRFARTTRRKRPLPAPRARRRPRGRRPRCVGDRASTAQFTVDDLFWGARKLFERLAVDRPPSSSSRTCTGPS